MSIFKKLLGKTKEGQFLKLFDEKDSKWDENFHKIKKLDFDFPIIENSIEYKDLGESLQQDEWLYVILDDEKKNVFLSKYLAHSSVTDGYNLINKNNYRELQVIFLLDGEKILFSYIEPRFLLKNQTKISFRNKKVSVIEEEDSLVFEGKIYAFFDGENKIYFKNFINARKIFGQEFAKVFEKMVSDKEAREFLNNGDFFRSKGNILDKKISDRNKKMIASIQEKLDILKDNKNFSRFIEYGRTLKKNPVKISEDNRFEFETANDIKNTLNLLEERVYVTPITEEERVATSYTN